MSRARVIQLIITIISLGFLVFFLLRLDWNSVSIAVRQSHPSWLVAAAGLVILNLLLKSFRFRAVAKVYGIPLSLPHAARIQTAGIGLALVTPGRVGEAVKVSLLSDRNVPASTGFGIVIFERIFDVLVLGLLALTLPFTLPHSPFPAWVGLLVLAVSITAIGTILRVRRIPSFLPTRLRTLLERGVPPEKSRNFTVILPLLLWTVAAWLTEALTQTAIFRSLDVSVPFGATIGVMAASMLAGVASLLPAGVGVLDLSIIGLYGLAGVPGAMATAFVASVRLVNTIFPVLLSTPLLLFRPKAQSKVNHGAPSSIP